MGTIPAGLTVTRAPFHAFNGSFVHPAWTDADLITLYPTANLRLWWLRSRRHKKKTYGKIAKKKKASPVNLAKRK
jgi:hypothetical protein